MKRLIRANRYEPYHVVVVDSNWNNFLNKIEDATGLEVDSAYRRRRKGDNWIELIDYDGKIYEAEITEYHNGDFEFRSENMHII